LKLFFALLATTLFATQLFAFKDAFYFGAYSGLGTGKSETDLSGGHWNLDQETEFSGIHLGTDFRFERSPRFKGRWELSYDNRTLTVTDDAGSEYEATGYRVGLAYIWGYAFDATLNSEIVPFFKLGYGVANLDHDLGNAYDTSFGVGIYYITEYFEIGIGADQEGRNYLGWKFDPEWFRDTQEKNLAPYVTVNIRLY